MARRALVAAPPAAPPLFGLVQASITVDEPDDRWLGGFTYEPEGCGQAAVEDPCDISNRGGGTPNQRSIVEYDPFLVWASEPCSAIGFNGRDWIGRGRRLLEAMEGAQIESEFWRGELAQAAGWPNRFLASEASDVVTSGAVTPQEALACLEQGLASCNGGQRGMIHATPQLVSRWSENGLVRREGARILTVLDTIVVPGAGYDGSGPYGDALPGSVWAYATGMVYLRRSAVEMLPSSFEEAQSRAQAARRVNGGFDNTIEVYAQRYAAPTFDGCCHFAAEVDIDPCGIGGVGS